jgi:hypothetical protein
MKVQTERRIMRCQRLSNNDRRNLATNSRLRRHQRSVGTSRYRIIAANGRGRKAAAKQPFIPWFMSGADAASCGGHGSQREWWGPSGKRINVRNLSPEGSAEHQVWRMDVELVETARGRT